MGDLGRLRWSCRRGLLELDLILTRFLERHLDEMDAHERHILVELLGYPDNDLLDWVMGRQEPPDPRYQSVVQLLRAG
jgi:antitoxin CptB